MTRKGTPMTSTSFHLVAGQSDPCQYVLCVSTEAKSLNLLKCTALTFCRVYNVKPIKWDQNFSFEIKCPLYYRKCGALSILYVRCARWEREIQRERERERERRKWRHLSSAELGDEFCTFPCQKFAPKFLLSWMVLSSHFPLPKTLRSSKQFPFFVLLRKFVTEDRSTETNNQISGCTVFLVEKTNQNNTKNYWK